MCRSIGGEVVRLLWLSNMAGANTVKPERSSFFTEARAPGTACHGRCSVVLLNCLALDTFFSLSHYYVPRGQSFTLTKAIT